ncbi:MAG: TIGR01906 family membrane protein [Anaerolineae bacterium]|nr:TIGR01906 family membrane protein [Anaerolineae bacterium]MDW8101838.1 TIGR01906 family membrane protein [Anaerolineae bacterium]
MRLFLSLLLAMGVFFIILLAPYPFLARPEFIRWEYARPGFPPSFRFTPEEREKLSVATLRYVIGGEGLEYLRTLSDESGPIYNERELRHMADVKRVASGALLALRLSLALAFLSATALWLKGWRRELILGLFAGTLLLVGFGLATGIMAFVNFDLFFTLFHRLFFEGDSWLFPYSDSLIQLYPLTFWVDATRWWLTISGATAGVFCLLGLMLHRFSNRPGQSHKLRRESYR